MRLSMVMLMVDDVDAAHRCDSHEWKTSVV